MAYIPLTRLPMSRTTYAPIANQNADIFNDKLPLKTRRAKTANTMDIIRTA
jgi:hypothetical protein